MVDEASAAVVYLDHAATTPLDPRVVEAMCRCLQDPQSQGNAASSGHAYGRHARALVENARAQVAQSIGAQPDEVIWTSGATESDNLAIFGVARMNADRGRHLVTARTEHKAVVDACRQLEREGFKVTWLKPDADGIVQPAQVEGALREDTQLVSLMHANNETGVIQDVAAVGALCRARGITFHVDAAQSAGKLPLDVRAMNIDLLSLTAHKNYGPKGIGALYVRRNPPLALRPMLYGGGQELGLRSGTLATHQIVGMGCAFELSQRLWSSDAGRIGELRDQLWQMLLPLGGVLLNGHPQQRLAGMLNVCFEGVEGESLRCELQEVAVSSGSACASDSDTASYVLRALGRSDAQANSSLRFSLGRFTTPAEIERAGVVISAGVRRLRTLAGGL